MSEYDDLLESVLEERDVPLVEGASGALLSPASRSSNTGSGEVPINQTSDGPAASPDKTGPPASELITETARERQEPVPEEVNRRGGMRASSQQPARRGMARQRERSGRCPMYAPAGTKCKTCEKVHPL